VSRASPTASPRSHPAFQTVGSFGKEDDNRDRNGGTKTKKDNEHEQ